MIRTGLIALTVLIYSTLGFAQSTITINIVGTDSVKLAFKNGDKEVKLNELNFIDGQGKLIITNETKSNKFLVNFINEKQEQFVIPARIIPTMGDDGKVANKTFTINEKGEVAEIPNSDFSALNGVLVANDKKQLLKLSGKPNSSV